AEINDVLLTGLAVAMVRWQWRRNPTAPRAVLVDLEGHGREELFAGLDLTRTVGWFTSVYPLKLDLGTAEVEAVYAGGTALGQVCKAVKEQRRRVPDKGLGCGLLRYLNAQTAGKLAGLARAVVGFTYLGRFAAAEGDWTPAAERLALQGAEDPDMPLAHVVE